MAEISYESPPDPATLALMCASLGWKVFPIRAGTKTPAVKNWPSEATTDPEKILMWWRTSPPVGASAGAGVGVATGPGSGIWVLDIDVKWAPGLSSVRDLFAAHGETHAPRTLRVSSPSGGQQWFFTYPKLTGGAWIGNISSTSHRHGPLGPGLEARGRGGQVVAPLSPGRVIIDPSHPALAPEWLVELVTRKPSDRREAARGSAGEDVKKNVESAGRALAATRWGRNDALNVAAYRLAAIGADRESAWEALRAACETNGLWDEDGSGQCEATFASGWGAGTSENREDEVKIRE